MPKRVGIPGVVTPPESGIDPVSCPSRVNYALKALAQGSATDEQQVLALNWIIDSACNRWDVPYRDSERDTNILIGRLFVGQEIIKQIKLNVKQDGEQNDD